MKQVKKVMAIAAAMALLGVTQTKANNTTHSLFGIDVSNFQGFVTWSSVHGNGADFAFAKATEGTTFTDADFSGNMSRGKGAGMQMGAYHFARPANNCVSPEANHFWAVAGGQITADGKSLFPTLDLEVFSGHSCQNSYTDWANQWAADVKAKTSHFLRPVIYISACNACFLNSGITLSAWIADYNGQNLFTGNPWSTCCSCDVWDGGRCNSNTWTYWQVSSSGSIGGVSGNCDFDAYNDTLALLKSNQGVQ
jgi:lysozyme